MARLKPIVPEIVEPDELLPLDLIALRRFSVLMDEAVAIPYTRFRVGLDAALGLIPGFGDLAAGLLSTWIIIGALRHRVSLPRIAQMVFYIVLDIILGSLPILGDTFDFLFEENVLNMKLLLRHRDRTRPPRSFGAIAGTALLVILVILAAGLTMVGLVIALAFWLIHKRNG